MAIRSVLYLPPYSPDLNPIEMVYSNIRQRLRSPPARRDQDTLWGAMQGVLDRVSSRGAATSSATADTRYM